MIIDAIASVAVIVGGLLAALGGIGLLRFPDVFTRMHAATKSATVGIIGITVAAALEAGALSGVLVLLLVIALLFLSGPLGMSLLARAAYYDPETPRAQNTRLFSLNEPDGAAHGIRRTSGSNPLLPVWLFMVWIALFGSFRPNIAIGGLIVAAAVTMALQRAAPRRSFVFPHPIATIKFVAYFTRQLFAATWGVVRMLGRRASMLQPAVVEVPLRKLTGSQVMLLMNAVSFTPGTVAIEVHHDRMWVHVLSTTDPAEVIAEADAMQRHIMEAFDASAGQKRKTTYDASRDADR